MRDVQRGRSGLTAECRHYLFTFTTSHRNLRGKSRAFQPGNTFGGSKNVGRKTLEWHDERRVALFAGVSDAMLKDAGEVLVNRMQTGDTGAAAVLLPFLLGKPLDPATLELNQARAELMRAQTAVAKLEAQKIKVEVANLHLEGEKIQNSILHERLLMEELRKRYALYFAQFITPEMFTQFVSAYMQRSLAVLQNLKADRWAQITSNPDGLAELKSLLGHEFEKAVEVTFNELPTFGDDVTVDTNAVSTVML